MRGASASSPNNVDRHPHDGGRQSHVKPRSWSEKATRRAVDAGDGWSEGGRMSVQHAGAKQSHGGLAARPPQVHAGRWVGRVRAYGSTPIEGATKPRKPDH